MARDLTNYYNTPIPEELQDKFDAFRASMMYGNNGIRDYDLAGWWIANGTPEVWRGRDMHFSDRWKKPNHETFSNESQYDDGTGGVWFDDTYYRPMSYRDPAVLWQLAKDAGLIQ